MGLIETVVPSRLGSGFRWLMASSWATNAGDGLALAAGPLLVASRTDDPRLVALAVLLQQLPWLLFGLIAGAIVDRLNRKVIVVVVDLLRGGVLVVLSVLIVTGQAPIGVVLVTLFALGTAEVFADTATSTLLPMLVDRDDLAIGNARLQTGMLTLNQLGGPPVGAALFAVGTASPFFAQAVLVLLGAVLISRLVLPEHGRVEESHVRGEIVAGFRWVRHHAAIRTLALTVFTFNITFGAAMSVLVLYAREQLGLGEVGYGLLLTVSAVGGLVGTVSYGWITRRVGLGNVMRVGLIIETLYHLVLAVTHTPAVAMVTFFVFGAHAFIWGTTAVTIRQRAVPTELQGRVSSVNMLGVYGGMVIGAALGGWIAHEWGIAAPFWFGFVGSAVFLAAIWRELAHIAHDEPLPVG